MTTKARSFVTAMLGVALAAGCGGDGPSPPAASAAAGGGGAPGGAGGAGGMQAGTPSVAGSSTVGGTSPAPSTSGSAGTTGGSPVNEGGTSSGLAGQAGGGGLPNAYTPISFGTKLDPSEQTAASQRLAQSLAAPSSPTWRAKGDQRRSYHFAEANEDVPYRVCVPPNWDGTSKLPLVMFLHGASNDESSYLDQNGKQMVKLAEQHGYVLVSPLGHRGAYGNFLRLPADFSKPDEAAKMLAMRTAQTEAAQELSEKDVINVLELVLNEYPIDRAKMFLTGHSMGSGGTWYIGGKYADYWAALAPMSGPFVLEAGYPWEGLRTLPVLVTEGLGAATVAGSHALRDWMKAQGFAVTYKEVDADHAGMVPLVLPDVFTFFDEVR
jgi:poly(3-hydroxybutyrate) depolymerase